VSNRIRSKPDNNDCHHNRIKTITTTGENRKEEAQKRQHPSTAKPLHAHAKIQNAGETELGSCAQSQSTTLRLCCRESFENGRVAVACAKLARKENQNADCCMPFSLQCADVDTPSRNLHETLAKTHTVATFLSFLTHNNKKATMDQTPNTQPAKKPSKQPAKAPSGQSAKTATSPKKAGKKSKKRTDTYKSCICCNAMKMVHPDFGISNDGMSVMNCLINDIFECIACEAGKFATCHKKASLSSREIQAAVREMLPGERLGTHAVSEGTRAVTRFCSATCPVSLTMASLLCFHKCRLTTKKARDNDKLCRNQCMHVMEVFLL